ncbi:MAG: hypothetical protein WCV86_05075 [Patescibacteria group bacterium]|jgi:capsular polysaccharide biosynthesis protein
MELNDYQLVFKRFIAAMIIITVLGGLAGFLVSSIVQDVVYDTSISFAVNRISRQDTPDYQYDGYYAIQAADLFSQTIVSWFSTPSVLLEMYRNAGIEPEITSIDAFSNKFRTRKYSSQNIVLRFHEATRERAEQISQSIIETAQARVKELNKTSNQEALFDVVASEPVIVEKQPNVIFSTLLGLIAGFIIGMIVAIGLHYLRPQHEAPRSTI